MKGEAMKRTHTMLVSMGTILALIAGLFPGNACSNSEKGILSLVQVAMAGERSLTLISAGKPNCVIVAPTDLTEKRSPEGHRPLKQNILDFQRILEKMSGAKVPILAPEEAGGAAVKIYVGDVSLPKGIKIDESKISVRGYYIIAEANTLVLRGKTEGGTANALYGFLQDKLGVRWYFPTELFEVIPTRKTIAIPYCNEIHNPSFKYGVLLAGRHRDWSEHMRSDTGAFRVRADPHYLGVILDSAIYGKTHPEYYPLLNGKRVIPAPRDRSGPQPCLSNPDVVKTVVEFCRRGFDANPRALSAAIGMNDSRIWCECDKCRAMDSLPLEKVNGIEQHSDRYFAFANQVAREITRSHPGRLVGCLAYSTTFAPPKTIERLEPNIVIALCADSSQHYDKAYRAKDYGIIKAWKKKGCKHIIIYHYVTLCWWWAPRYYPHQEAANVKNMYERGVVGWWGGFNDGSWATQGPMFYLLAQLMWDVDLDPDKVLDDFFIKSFGPEGGQEMKAYYAVFERAWMRPTPGRSGKRFEGWSSVREQMALYKLSDLNEALAHLAKAKELAKDDLARKRIDYIADSFSYPALAMRGWLTSDAIDKLDREDITSPEKAREVRDMLRQISHALKNEEAVYQKTLLVDPISSRDGKLGHTGHFGIIRGLWPPRCKHGLINGSAMLLEYYKNNNMSDESSSFKNELPAEIYRVAEERSRETLGDEIILNGNMENGNPPVNWQVNAAKLSASTDCHSGKQSLRIAPSVGFGSAVQYFAVKPDTRYRLEFWYKCIRPGSLYTFVRVAGEKRNSYGDCKEDNEWTRLIGYFTTSKTPSTTKAYVSFCAWATKRPVMPGKDTLIDDVSIREVKPANLMDCKKIDKKFPDWQNPGFALNTADKLGNYGGGPCEWRGPEKFNAVACIGWQDKGIRLVVRVKDDDYSQPYKGSAIWRGDSIQFGIDAGADGDKTAFGSGCDDVNDFLYGLSLLERPGSHPELYRWNAPKGKPTGDIPNDGERHRYSVKVENGVVLYDVLISWSELGMTPEVGNKFGFNLVVFDRYKLLDGASKLMWMQLTPGIAGSEGQSPSFWRKFAITEQ